METMTKRKVSELEGAELNYWVARAEGVTHCDYHELVFVGSGMGNSADTRVTQVPLTRDNAPEYSTDWGCGGPIIERERINLTWLEDEWGAEQQGGCIPWEPGYGINQQRGQTPLVAAMRCFVASKFGKEVDDH